MKLKICDNLASNDSIGTISLLEEGLLTPGWSHFGNAHISNFHYLLWDLGCYNRNGLGHHEALLLHNQLLMCVLTAPLTDHPPLSAI